MSIEAPDAEPAFPFYYETNDTGAGDVDPTAGLPDDSDVDAAAMTAPEGWGGEEEPGLPPAAGGGDSGDNDPPTDVPAEASDHEPEPERGESLRKIFDYADASGGIIHDQIVDVVEQTPEAAPILEELAEKGMSHGDAIQGLASLSDPGEESLSGAIADAEMEDAARSYGEDLERAGLALEMGLDSVEVEVVDPDAYARALDNMQAPESEVAKEVFDRQSVQTTSGAMISAANGLLQHDVDERQTRLAQELPEQGAKLATALERLDAPPAIVEAAKIMATAHSEGLDKLWAEGYNMWLIGNSDIPMGYDRFVSQEEWEQAGDFLGRVAETAPGSQFGREVLATVSRDVDRAIAHPYQPSDEQPPERFRERYEELREATHALSQPILQEAREMLRRRLEDS